MTNIPQTWEDLSETQQKWLAGWKYTGNPVQQVLKTGPRKPLFHNSVVTPEEAHQLKDMPSDEIDLIPIQVSVGNQKTIGIERWWIDFAERQGETTSGLLKRSPWALRCVEIRSRALASIPWELDPNRTEFERLLVEVNPESNWPDFIAALEADLNVYGKGFWLKIYKNGKLKFLQRQNPAVIEIDANRSGIAGFKNKDTGDVIRRKEMVYFHTYNPENDVEGLAPIATVKDAINIEYESNKTLHDFFENRAMPDYVMSLETTNKNEIKRVADFWKKEFEGRGKQHKTGWVGSNGRPYEIGYAPEKLALEEVRAEARRQICGGLGVPPALVGAWEAANYATIREQRQSLYTETIIPRAEYVAGVINAELADEFNTKLSWRFDKIVAMQETEDQKAKRLVWFVQAGILKPESAARLAGFDEDDVPEPQPVPSQLGNDNNQNNMGRDTSPPPMSDERKTVNALRKWRRKSINYFKDEKGMPVPFESDYISDALYSGITSQLKEIEEINEIRDIFDAALDDYADA